MKKGILWALSLLLLILVLPVSAEVLLSCVPENPAVGDTIDVTVSAGPGAVSVIYTLTANGKTVFSGKEDPHFVAAFRPRQEADYELRAAVVYADGTRETAETFLTVSGMAEEQADSGIIYNQKDGWWKNKSYAKSTMDQSGCAIFALSHALQRMGYTGSDVLPEAMGIAYANCLSVDGTRNGRLITQASEVYHFVTQEDLLERVSDIADGLKNGDMYSFGIVIGHIALADGISENGKMVHVTDSAPSATFERIKNASLYYQNEQGQFIAAKSLEEMPGFRWFFETSSCGGLEYYLEIGYTARRGLRLIRPPWLFRKGSGEPEPVTLVYPGTAVTTIESAGEKEEIPSAELEWETNAAADQRYAVVSKKSGAVMKNSAGKKIMKIPACSVLPVRRLEGRSAYVMYKGTAGYVSVGDVQLTGTVEGPVTLGTITLNGSASGRASIKIRFAGSSSGRVIDNWKTGTRVAVLSEKKGYCQIEAKGIRVWVQDDYLTRDQ